MKTETKNQLNCGRKPKLNPANFRYSVNFTAPENAEFLSRFEQSGLQNKSKFIAACIFNRQLKVMKLDKVAMDCYMRLTTFYSQFRATRSKLQPDCKAFENCFYRENGVDNAV